MNIRKGMRNKKIRNMAKDIGKKCMAAPYAALILPVCMNRSLCSITILHRKL